MSCFAVRCAERYCPSALAAKQFMDVGCFSSIFSFIDGFNPVLICSILSFSSIDGFTWLQSFSMASMYCCPDSFDCCSRSFNRLNFCFLSKDDWKRWRTSFWKICHEADRFLCCANQLWISPMRLFVIRFSLIGSPMMFFRKSRFTLSRQSSTSSVLPPTNFHRLFILFSDNCCSMKLSYLFSRFPVRFSSRGYRSRKCSSSRVFSASTYPWCLAWDVGYWSLKFLPWMSSSIVVWCRCMIESFAVPQWFSDFLPVAWPCLQTVFPFPCWNDLHSWIFP